jgi:hypothetical protein
VGRGKNLYPKITTCFQATKMVSDNLSLSVNMRSAIGLLYIFLVAVIAALVATLLSVTADVQVLAAASVSHSSHSMPSSLSSAEGKNSGVLQAHQSWAPWVLF